MATSMYPVTTEIDLHDDHPSSVENRATTVSNQFNQSSPQLKQSTPITKNTVPVIGSATVGSRLAGDDAVGSRLASSDGGGNAHPDYSEPALYNPNRSSLHSSNSSHSAGFGNVVQQGNGNAKKLTNLSLQEVQQVAAEKAELVKSWSVKTYKCTKQMLNEKMGRGSRTVDLELEAKIEILRDTKLRYENMLSLAKTLAGHFSSMVQTQKVLASSFAELASKSQELQDEFRYNAETQMVVSKSGEKLLSALNFFVGNITTLCSKTMDDSLLTVSKYESARLSYDAYRTELESINALQRTDSNIMKQASAQANFNAHKIAYERLRDDVKVKLQFLDENRSSDSADLERAAASLDYYRRRRSSQLAVEVKVMQKNLLLFHNAIAAYFAGNQQQLEGTLEQFSIKVASRDAAPSSFLERH